MKPSGLMVLSLLLLTILFPGYAYCQKFTDTDPEVAASRQNTAEVKVDGNFLFHVNGIFSYPAPLRAEAITQRIIKVASNPVIPADSVKIIEGRDGSMIYGGKEFIMNVHEIDAKAEKVNRVLLAEFFEMKIRASILSYRSERSSPLLVKKTIHAVFAVFLFALLLFLLYWLIKRINTSLQTRIKSRIDTVENKSFSLIRSAQMWKAFHLLIKTVKIVLTIVLIFVFLQYVLGLFPWTKSFANFILDLFLNPLIIVGKGFVRFLPSLAFLVVLFFITRYLLKLIRLLFNGIRNGVMVIRDFDPDWAMPTYKILRIVVVAFAVIIAYPYIPGSDSSAFKGVTVFLGVLFSLGSTSVIGNVIAGYSMAYRRAFKIGDLIEENGQKGFVEEQKLLVTRLRSIKNEEIVIPNSVLLNSNIINYSKKARDLGLILHTSVGIGYETPWRQVDAMLKEAANRTIGLLKEPPPFVLKTALGDFAINYEINVYCADVPGMPVYYSLLHQNILDVFNENNVQIMTPAYVGDPQSPKVVQKEQWNTPLSTEG